MNSIQAITSQMSKDFRIVDLSEPIYPGVQKVDGTYHWGKMRRKFELKQFIAPGPHYMNFVETESHIGTHVELPAHVIEGGASATEMPLDVFFGECIVLKFDFLKPEGGKRKMIMPEHFKNVKAGDIVLMWSPYLVDYPALSMEAAEMLADLPIKMIGYQHASIPDNAHHVLLPKKDGPIPIIEELYNLDTIQKERILFFGFPLRVSELDSSWIRAVGFEPKD